MFKHTSLHLTLALLLGLASANVALAAPSSPGAPVGPIHFSAPGGATSMGNYASRANLDTPVAPAGSIVPQHLASVVTEEEFQLFLDFQNRLRDDPAIKSLTTEIMGHVEAMRKLQLDLNQARTKALDADPKAKAIAMKINEASSALPRPDANRTK